MKLVFLINTLGGGGAEKQLMLTSTSLAKAGHDCVVVTLQGVAPHPRMEPFIAAAREAGVEWQEPSVCKRFVWGQVWRLRRILQANRDAVLWTWGYRADVVRLMLAVGGLRPRTLVALRSADAPRLHRYRWFWRLLNACTDAFVSNTWLNIEQLEKIVPGISRRGVVIYNALDKGTRAFPQVRLDMPPAKLRIVMLGNLLISIKGYDFVAPLARLIREQGLPWEIHIGGALFQGEELQAQLDQAGVGDIVRLEGLVKDPLAFLSSGHVFLMLSRVEGMPNALLEAMSVGLPAVCTRVGDVPRFAQDGEHLRLVDVGDVAGTMRVLIGLWTDWPGAVAMGRRGRALCHAMFTEERLIAETLALLQRLESPATKA